SSARARPSGRPYSADRRCRFSSTLRPPYSMGSCATNPIRPRTPGTPKGSSPQIHTRPWEGRRIAARTRNSVDFPEPLGPRIASAWPGATVRPSPRRTRRRPKPFQRSSAWTASPARSTSGRAAAGADEVVDRRRIKEKERIAAIVRHIPDRRVLVQRRAPLPQPLHLGGEGLGEQAVHLADPVGGGPALRAGPHGFDVPDQAPFLLDEPALRVGGRREEIGRAHV